MDFNHHCMAALFGVSAVITAPLLLVEPMRWVLSSRGILMIVHLGVLTVGFVYEWRKGALEWD